MRYFAVIMLTLSQFSAFPFLAMVAANTARQQALVVEESGAQATNTHNVTTVYKTVPM
jgi:hypothetical protein